MNRITRIPEAQGILYSKGVYRQVDLYQRRDDNRAGLNCIYARFRGGFVRLTGNGGTSLPDVRWDEIETPDGEWEATTFAVTYTPGPSYAIAAE